MGLCRPGHGYPRGSLPLFGIQDWILAMLEDFPKPVEYQFASDYSGVVIAYCLDNWLAAGRCPLPSAAEAAAGFRASLAADGDLSPRQVDQLCQRTFSTRGELQPWLAGTTERFLGIVRPWIPIWIQFTQWALTWCKDNSVGTLAFLARDALPFFVAATALEQAPCPERAPALCLAHVSRAVQPDTMTVDSILRQPSVALIDSGCYGTCINRLRQLRDSLADGPGPGALATLLYYSRNPQLFGYINYIMCADMLTHPRLMRNVTDFIIYAGDLLEALPKPYRYAAGRPGTASPSDILSFTISLATLHEISEIAQASKFLDFPGMDQAHEQARILYRNYQISRHLDELCRDLPFDEPTPKTLPSPGALSGLDFLEVPPQSHIFGTACG
jgi:hypothetical protein